MVKEIRRTYNVDNNPNIREIMFEYEAVDEELVEKMKEFLNDNQSLCVNCQNYYYKGSFGGYQASNCKLYGCLEARNNPHYDGDGSKCKDYKRANKGE